MMQKKRDALTLNILAKLRDRGMPAEGMGPSEPEPLGEWDESSKDAMLELPPEADPTIPSNSRKMSPRKKKPIPPAGDEQA